jgi:hypothetical protein
MQPVVGNSQRQDRDQDQDQKVKTSTSLIKKNKKNGRKG